MDPKNSSQLDPKLKEAYDRVMGTTITPSAPTSQPQTPVATAPQQTQSPPVPPTPQPAAPQIYTASTLSKPDVVAPSQTPTMTTNSGVNSFVANSGKAKSGGFSPILIILGLLVFFVVYAIFWVKFFGISIPFLPL